MKKIYFQVHGIFENEYHLGCVIRKEVTNILVDISSTFHVKIQTYNAVDNKQTVPYHTFQP